jgi:hypothetical protein
MNLRNADKFPQIACVTRPVPHQVKAMTPIASQLRKAGYRVRETFDRCPPEAIVFCWGNGWAKEIRAVHRNVQVCVMDHGLFNPRKQAVLTGWQGLNGWGEHPVVDDGGERLRAKGWDKIIQPPRLVYKPKDGYVLILGQVYGDAAIVDAIEDYGDWLFRLAQHYAAQGWEVRFRPHPVQARNGLDRYPNVGARTSHERSIYEDFDGAAIVVAMNSNGLLDALMYGVQDVRLFNKGSMLYPISNVLDGGFEGNERRVYFADRTRLAERMAWCQWDPEEIDNGEWIKYHAPIMERIYATNVHQPWHGARL